MLNPNSPIPLYHQLADILYEQIRSGLYLPEKRIPSENRLAKQYHIGRPTVRQAVELLVRKDVVKRKRGSGTFVKAPKKEIDLFSLAGTSQAFKTKGVSVTTKILAPVSLKKIDARDHYNPFSGQHAYFFSRLTLAKDKPVLFEAIFLDSELFNNIDKIDLTHKSLAQVVRDHYYIKPVDGRQRFKIIKLSKGHADIMHMKKNDPVLEVKRTLNFPGASKAVFSRLICSTDDFEFSQTILGDD